MKKAFICLLASLASIGLVSCQTETVSSKNTSTPISTPISTSTSTSSSTTTSSSSIETSIAHIISLKQVEGVTLTSDKTEAKKLETVTITISDVAIDKKVTLKATPSVEFTPGENANTYTFVMPDNDVTISADIVTLENTISSFKTYIRALQNKPVPTFTVNGETRNIDQIYAGDNVTLSFLNLSSSDFVEGNTFYIYVGNQVLSGKVVNDQTSLSLTFNFVAPEEKGDLVLAAAAATVDPNGSNIIVASLPEGVKIYGLKEGDKYKVENSLAYFYIKKEVGYKVSFEYKIDNGEVQKGVIDQDGFGSIQFKGNVEIKFTSENVGFHKINYVGEENIVSINRKTDFELPKAFTVGETLLLQNIGFKEGKYLEEIVITGADGKQIGQKITSSYIYLVMPDQDVTITFTVKDNGKITFTGWEDYLLEAPKVIDGYSLSSGKEVTSAPKGKSLYVYIKPKANYKVGGMKYGDTTTNFYVDSSNPGYYYAYLTMPEGDVALSLTNVVLLHTVTIENADLAGASVTISTNSFGKGDTVNFNITTPDAFYTLKSLVVTYNGKSETWTAGKEFTVNDSGRNGSFTMVDFDISIKPVFEKVQAIDVAVSLDEGVNFSYRTSVSNQNLDQTTTSAKLLPNDQISITSVTAPLSTSSKYVQIQVTDTNNEVTKYDPVYLSSNSDSISYNYSSSFSVTKENGVTIKAIKFALVDRQLINVTINNDSKIGLKFKINDKETTDLTTLKQFDKLEVTLDETTFEKGYTYSYVLKDDKGNQVTANAGKDTYLLLSNSSLTLEIAKKKTYSVTVKFTPTDKDTTYTYWGLSVDGNYVYNTPTTFLEGAKVTINSITIQDKNYNTYSWTLQIKIGDKTYTSDSNSIYITPVTFVVDGDVEFTFTLA